MKDYEKEFMRKIYKEIKLMQENNQRKVLIKFICYIYGNICNKLSRVISERRTL